MSNYVEFKNKIAFHPGYYVKEIIEDSGLTQEEFAKRLDTTPKNLSILIRGEQSLSVEMAMKLARMQGSSMQYWLNLQNEYDSLIAEFDSQKELEKEKVIMKELPYSYFKENFDLPDYKRDIDSQIKAVREFLGVSSLTVFEKFDFSINYRASKLSQKENSKIKGNIMVQIAVNEALKVEAPKYNKSKFNKAIKYALRQTTHHSDFYPLLKKAFQEAGVIFVVLPSIPGCNINGATRKVGDHVLLMVNDRRHYADTFWFTLFHEIGHIINGDFGISCEKESGKKEYLADKYAQDKLLPSEEYKQFLKKKNYSNKSIEEFAQEIDRDAGIVVGRLQNEGYIRYNDKSANKLKKKYIIK